MIGNNSAGARSIVYGKTVDHVREVGVVLADGTRARFGPVDAAEWERRAAANTAENLRLWLEEPDAIKPGSLMPAIKLNDADLDALVGYMQSLR